MIDIVNVEKYVENNRIEAKRSLGGLPKSIWETYSAFANTLGGIILLGVEEYRDKSFHAIDLPDPQGLIDEFWSIINNKARVSKNILTENDISVEIIDGKHIVAIRVPRAARYERPIYIDGSAYSGTYRRSGEGDYKCTAEQVESMLRDAAGTWDDKITEDMGDLWLDIETFARYKKRSGINDPELCSVGGALRKDGLSRPTVAELLMFGRIWYIRKVFPDFSLIYNNGNTIIKDLNVFDFYSKVENELEKYAKKDKNIKSAMCEALANCLINADYHLLPGVIVTASKDEIVFVNSGSLRIDVERAMVGGVSDPRNALIKSMFKRLEIGKSVGGGIPNIYSAWETAGYPSPTLKETFSPDCVEFRLSLKKNKSVERNGAVSVKESYAYREIVVTYLTNKMICNIKDISDLLGIDETSGEEILEDMVYDGLIELCGNKEYKLRS